MELLFYDGEQIKHCLVGEVTAQSIFWLDEYGYLKLNILPEAGGLNNQWEKDLQAFSIIAYEKGLLEARDASGHGDKRYR